MQQISAKGDLASGRRARINIVVKFQDQVYNKWVGAEGTEHVLQIRRFVEDNRRVGQQVVSERVLEAIEGTVCRAEGGEQLDSGGDVEDQVVEQDEPEEELQRGSE